MIEPWPPKWPSPNDEERNEIGYLIHVKIFGDDEIGRWKMDIDWKVKCRELAHLLILREGIEVARMMVEQQ